MEQGKCGNLLKLMMGTALAELVDFLVVICSFEAYFVVQVQMY